MADPTLEELIAQVLPQFENKQDLAQACGMTPSGFGRGMSKNSMTVLNLLKLAQVGGLDPLVVLRAAGKDKVAEVIEDLFRPGGAKAPVLSRPDRELLDLWHALPPHERATYKSVFRMLGQNSEPRRAASKTRKHKRTA